MGKSLLFSLSPRYKQGMRLPVRIATRNSQLALWQANEVKRLLLAAAPELDESDITLVAVTSDGERSPAQPLAHFGFKGVFTKRIEAALLDDLADIAVHSMKDLHSEIPDSLTIAAILEREDPRDAFLSLHYDSPEALPQGARVGTSSIRRSAMLHRHYPQLDVVAFRGNVPTRLEKLQRGEVDATLLAVAGLKRLALEQYITTILHPSTILPAVAQGAIGIECRRDDDRLYALLRKLSHPQSEHCILAERALLRAIDGDCHTPIGGHASIKAQELTLKAEWLLPDGSKAFTASLSGAPGEAERIGTELGAELKAQYQQATS